jgi:hypothetical protein
MELVDCICSAIDNVNIKLMENLYGLILKYLPNEIEDNMYILMMSNWKYSTKSNKKILLKIYEFINKDSKIDPRCFFRGGKKDIYTLNILINEGRIEKDIQKVLLKDTFSLPNLIRYPHLYKSKNIKKLIRHEFKYRTYSNNKLKRMFRKLKKIFQNDKYLENQFRYVLNKKKINLSKNEFLKTELIKPTKIYVKEVLKLLKYNLINGCANITGGGITDNIKRVIPSGLTANINLSKIKTKKIFKWLKKNNIDDKEMLKTFNCGVGFCIIIDQKNFYKIKKFFTKEFEPYIIGNIIAGKNKIKINEKINWS